MRINITCPRSVGRKAAPPDSIGPPPGEPIVEAGALRPCSRRLVLYRDWPPIRGRTIVLHRDRVEAPYRGLWAPSVPVHAFRAAIFGDAEFRLRINLSTPRSSVLARSRNDRSGHSDIAMWLYCLRMRCDAGRKHHPGEGDKRAEGVHHGRSPSAGVGGPEGLVPLSRAETDSRFKDRLINDPGLWQHIDVACRNQDRAGGGGGSALDRHEGKRAVPSCSFGGRSGIFSRHAACPLNLLAGHGGQGFGSGGDAMQSQAEERALLKAIAAGDAKSLERLFARAQTRVFRFLMRVVKRQEIAEELLNEVFLSVWQNAHRYEGRSEPLTWVLSIAHNKAMSALRKKTEVLGIADEAARDLVAEEDPPDIAAQKHDKSAKIRACIGELSADQIGRAHV